MRYVVVPRNKAYWIERIDFDGSRTVVERWATETEAVKRLQSIQEKAEAVEQRNARFAHYAPAPPR